jgi:hypothetical protein
MDYKEMPVEERIKKASEYALLVVADNKPEEEIIGILKKDFNLTHEQAFEAFTKMRSEYKEEYASTTNSNVYKLVGSIAFCVFVVIAYYFMGSEMGSFKAFPMLFVVLFGFAALGGIIVLSRTLWEKYTSPAFRQIHKKPATLPAPGKGENLHWTSFGLLLAFVIFFATASVYFGNSGIVNGNEIETIQDLIISNPVTQDHTSGKNRSYYYIFTFRGHQNEFRFYDDYYKYSKYPLDVSTFKEGDTISIQIFYEDWKSLINSQDKSTIKMINVARKNAFFIDHAFRNAQLKKDHTNQLKFGLIFLGAMLVVKLIWIGLNYFKRDERQV